MATELLGFENRGMGRWEWFI